MKHCVTFLTLVLVLAGCGNRPKLRIADLKFGDFEKEAIARNRVETMFKVSKSLWLNMGWSDTIGHKVFDREGNLLYDQETFHRITYDYDSNGLVTAKNYDTDFPARYWATYKFEADSLLLYQYWTGMDTDTCIFRFDAKGRLTDALEFANDDTGRGQQFETINKYDDKGTLIQTSCNYIPFGSEIRGLRGLSKRYVTKYFYTQSALSSALSTVFYVSEERPFTAETFFNKGGLRDSTVLIDSLVSHEFKNFMTGKTWELDKKGPRDTLVTYYTYKLGKQ